MKFIRHNSAAVTNLMQLDFATTDRPKIRLRGSIFLYTPRPMAIIHKAGDIKDREVETDGQTVTLIYRGHTYERTLQPSKPYQQPRNLNWRWQRYRACEICSEL